MQIASKMNTFFRGQTTRNYPTLSEPTRPEFIDNTIAEQTAMVSSLVNLTRLDY